MRKPKVLVLSVRVRDPELVAFVESVVGKGRRKKKGGTTSVLLAGLRSLRDVARAVAGEPRVVPACSCPADERNKDGCTCQAGVG